jgi:hypothetical protein
MSLIVEKIRKNAAFRAIEVSHLDYSAIAPIFAPDVRNA